MKRKKITLLIWLFSFSTFGQNDSTYQIVGETVDIEYLKDGVVYYYLKDTKEPFSGWVKYIIGNNVDLFEVENGKKNGPFFSYKKTKKGYHLAIYKLYNNDYAKESIIYKPTNNGLIITKTIIYNLTCNCDKVYNCSLLWLDVVYKKKGYKVTITYKYGDKGKTQEVKYWLKELDKLTTPISLDYLEKVNMPLTFKLESDIPPPPY